jgi:nucleoside-diphosphate-sugar epimerase
MAAPGRIAIVGATGPTGRALARELHALGRAVRVISRRGGALQACFPQEGIEKAPGDALDFASLSKALEGCGVVVDCIGLPPDRMDEHAATARNIARFVAEAGARCLQVSSYWAYMPIRELPISERHPRSGGPPWAKARREAEDILRSAGAAVVHLPDFFGPHVHTSTVQLAILSAMKGGPMDWIGPADVERDCIYVPDAMRVVAQLLTNEAAYGEDWMLPGSGPVSARRLAQILSGLLRREVRVRAAPPWLLRLLSFFKKDLRGFMQMVPEYVKPLSFDGAKLERLLGPTPRTSYEEALRETVASIRVEAP